LGGKKIKPAKKTSKPVVLQDNAFERLKAWAEQHSTLVVGTAAAVFFLIAAIWGVRIYGERMESQAKADYAVLAAKLPSADKEGAGGMQKMIPDLEKFVSEHKGTRPAVAARLELAKALFQAKRYDDAIKAASEALSSAPPGHGLRPLILYQLAVALEAAGKPDEALKQWAQLKELGDTGLEREAEWNTGKIYAAKKDYAKAADAYQKAAEALGTFPPEAMLDEELARVKREGGIKETAAK
jgi:predicted negative regulator of RcsB-dependent stress response